MNQPSKTDTTIAGATQRGVAPFFAARGLGLVSDRTPPLSLLLHASIGVETQSVIGREDSYLERSFCDGFCDYEARARRCTQPRSSGCKNAPVHRNFEVTSRLTMMVALSLVLASCASLPTSQEANDAVLMLQKYESWAWALGIVLIWADLMLPIPQTVVIAALGIVYGTFLGGLLGSFGLITGGLLGYGLMRTSARRFVQRFVSPRSLQGMEKLFERNGAWAIILTRSLPHSVPEILVLLAGLASMPMGKFIAALTVGSVPTAFAFAALGAGWADQPIAVLVVSYVLPILLLPVVLYLMRPRET